MDATTSSGASSSLPLHLIIDDALALVSPLQQSFQRSQRHCFGGSAPGEFPLAANPSIVLHVLTSCNLEPDDLAHLEASSVLFFLSNVELILPDEICACDRQHARFSGSLPISLPIFSCQCQNSQRWICARNGRYLNL